MGHISISVNEVDLKRAQEIVEAFERGDFALEDED